MQQQTNGNTPAIDKALTEAGLVKQVRIIQRRSVEGARDRDFRPVRPPLKKSKPSTQPEER